MSTEPLDRSDLARVSLLHHLAAEQYTFTTPSPTTHRRVLLRRGRVQAKSLVDVFGWNLAFQPKLLGEPLFELMSRARMLVTRRDGFAAALRVASVGRLLFLHSAFGARSPDRVFFGPDSFRFAEFIRAETPSLAPGSRILDVGAGAGVGGLLAASLGPGCRVVLTDINPSALHLARVNAAFAGVKAEAVVSNGLCEIDGDFDLIVANPPYVGGAAGPLYSRGGGSLGESLSLRWAQDALGRLAPNGRLLLYTGSAIVAGQDRLRQALARASEIADCALSYRELDPDVFPSLLLKPAYWRVERIAAVGAVALRRGATDRPPSPP